MDTPGSVPESLGSSVGHNLSPTAYRKDPWDAVITPSGGNSDGEFLSSSSSRYGAGKKNSTKLKEDEAMNIRRQVSSSPSNDMTGKKEGQHNQLRMMGLNRAGERRLSSGSRKTSTGSDDGSLSGKREDNGKESAGRDRKEGQYHRIETLVSPCTEGAPIQTLSYSNRPLAGERIKTVESIRVIGRGSRRGGGGAGGRAGGAMWYEEEEYMEAQPPSPRTGPPPPNIGQGGAEDMNPSMPPPHPQLLLPHLHPPPGHPHPHPHLPPQAHFQMPYHTDPPPSHHHHHQHLPPPSSFFSNPPPIPRPPPPPLPQHSSLPSAVMVGGVLVPP
ncbi:unnamed protein product [Pleuronectes platessa]|uniref:Uncharacterized protein n=1 Tax=Pleuronectes platessa TaxID=8262 RepID=A0A9N7VAK4_PLEPL|nr:unnamed protein product [Pleuronectes platessa]